MPSQLVTSEELTRYFDEHPGATMVSAAAHFDVSISTINTRMATGAAGRELRLSDLDVRVFQFIIDYIDEHGWSPSVTDVVEGVGCSRSAAHVSMHRLAAHGSIVLGDGPRTIRVVGAKFSTKGVKRDPR